jgi:hypothetical protein
MTTEPRTLWEHGHWRCEYRPQTARELPSIRVFSEGKLLFVQHDRSPDALLRVAEHWSQLCADLWRKANDPARHDVPPELPDRRGGPDDRRRLRRGGRRATDWR